MDTQISMPLEGSLDGYSIIVDTDQITLGFFEDLESPLMKDNLNALTEVIVGGRLPHGDITADTLRPCLRKLKPAQFNDLAVGMQKALRVPKNA